MKSVNEKPRWIKLKEGDLILYVYIHSDPAIHQRFSIERAFLWGRKSPTFIVNDKLGCTRRLHHDRLLDAKKAVKDTLHIETIAPDIRVVVINAYKRDDPEGALITIIDHFEKRLLEEADRSKQEFETFKRKLRNLSTY